MMRVDESYLYKIIASGVELTISQIGRQWKRTRLVDDLASFGVATGADANIGARVPGLVFRSPTFDYTVLHVDLDNALLIGFQVKVSDKIELGPIRNGDRACL